MRGVRRSARLVALALPVVLVAALSAAAARDATPSAGRGTPTAGLPGVTSVVLAHGAPDAAPASELSIGRVVIEPGASIPPHEHPGTQVAAIVDGELTYTVLTGSVPVTRAASSPATPADRADFVIDAGETFVLTAGDSVVEQPGALHTARNAGDKPVVILLATLFDPDQPRTIFAATPAP